MFRELILRNSTCLFEVVNEMCNIVSWLISPNISIVLCVNTSFNFFKDLWRKPARPPAWILILKATLVHICQFSYKFKICPGMVCIGVL